MRNDSFQVCPRRIHCLITVNITAFEIYKIVIKQRVLIESDASEQHAKKLSY